MNNVYSYSGLRALEVGLQATGQKGEGDDIDGYERAIQLKCVDSIYIAVIASKYLNILYKFVSGSNMSARKAASDATNNNFNELGATVGRQNTWILMEKQLGWH